LRLERIWDKGQLVAMRNRHQPSEQGPGGYCGCDLGILTVTGHMNRSHLGAFQEALQTLVEDDFEAVEVDFSGCRYLSSLFIGHLVDAVLSAKQRGKTIRVRVSPELGRFFETAHLKHIFEYEIAEDRIESGISSAVR
jgi:anti-anti-sigma factor